MIWPTDYGFEKRQKEIRRQKKKEQKREERRAKKQPEAGEGGGDEGETGGEDAAEVDVAAAEEKARGEGGPGSRSGC